MSTRKLRRMSFSDKYQKIVELYKLLFSTPTKELCLQIEKTRDNDPFFEKMTNTFYKNVTKRHPKMPIFGTLTRGVSINVLSSDFATYLKSIESSGMRNIKKAKRLGYTFARIEFNDHIDGVWDIRKSAPVRQGAMATDFMEIRPKEQKNPKSANMYHDYPYFGVFDENGVLAAYAGCFLAGDVIELSHYYGHAEHQKNGVVPLIITSIAEYVLENHTNIKAYLYGGYIGASPTLKRFKKKFGFLPHHVKWRL